MALEPHSIHDTTLGASFLAAIVVAILFGLTSLQTWLYYQNFAKDSKLLRYLIFFLWILDALHLVFMTHANYYYLVTHFGDYAAHSSPTWSLLSQCVVTVIGDLIVRGIFGWRVWRLSHGNIPLAVVISITSFFVFATGLAFSIKAFYLWCFSDFSSISWLLYGSLSSTVVIDGIIATALCVLLWRSRSAVRQTNSIIKVLMLYSINTGLLTCVIATLAFITYATMPYNFIYIALLFILSKMYLNALLANLNARSSLRDNTICTKSISFAKPANAAFRRDESTLGDENQSNDSHSVDLESGTEQNPEMEQIDQSSD